jgi:hypothetical protein
VEIEFDVMPNSIQGGSTDSAGSRSESVDEWIWQARLQVLTAAEQTTLCLVGRKELKYYSKIHDGWLIIVGTLVIFHKPPSSTLPKTMDMREWSGDCLTSRFFLGFSPLTILQEFSIYRNHTPAAA